MKMLIQVYLAECKRNNCEGSEDFYSSEIKLKNEFKIFLFKIFESCLNNIVCISKVLFIL